MNTRLERIVSTAITLGALAALALLWWIEPNERDEVIDPADIPVIASLAVLGGITYWRIRR
jgi:hypothetical protein